MLLGCFYLFVGQGRGWSPEWEVDPCLSHSRFDSHLGFHRACDHHICPKAESSGCLFAAGRQPGFSCSLPLSTMKCGLENLKKPILPMCKFQLVCCNTGQKLSNRGRVLMIVRRQGAVRRDTGQLSPVLPGRPPLHSLVQVAGRGPGVSVPRL